jgi:ribonuclease HII
MSLQLDLEQQYWSLGENMIVGVDEVGRGSLAGPVVAAAVSFYPDHQPISGIQDSKKTTKHNRLVLSKKIHQQAQKVVIREVSVKIINAKGIAHATKLAITRCLDAFNHIDRALIDGIWAAPTTYPCEAIVRGDALCYSIATASIVAKVYRDQLMKKISDQYPDYRWDLNMGYGTTLHRMMIKKIGPSPFHRTLFIRKCLAQ